MNNDMSDDKMKQLFNKMRREDQSGCPSFGQTVSKSMIPSRPIESAWKPAAAAALIILAGAGVVMLLVSQPDSSPEPAFENWSVLSNWKASTDNMLAFANTKIDSTLTSATDALLNGVPETLNTQHRTFNFE